MLIYIHHGKEEVMQIQTDLAKVDNDEVVKNLFIINSRPRNCLGWKTPLNKCCTWLDNLSCKYIKSMIDSSKKL